MLDDAIPAFADVERVEFSGAENYAIERSEGGPSYREDDVYTRRAACWTPRPSTAT